MYRPEDTTSPNMTEQAWKIIELQVFRVRQLGDQEREMNRWRDSFKLRTGRAA
jgi:hypothetical protein